MKEVIRALLWEGQRKGGQSGHATVLLPKLSES